jgi:hypothetical protein
MKAPGQVMRIWRSRHLPGASPCREPPSRPVINPCFSTASRSPGPIPRPAKQEDLQRCDRSCDDHPGGRCPKKCPCGSTMVGAGNSCQRSHDRSEDHDGGIEGHQHAGEPPQLLAGQPLLHASPIGPRRSPQAPIAHRQPDDGKSQRRGSCKHAEKDPRHRSIPVLSCVAAHWLRIAHQEVESIGEQDEQPERNHRHARKKPCAPAHGRPQVHVRRLAPP